LQMYRAALQHRRKLQTPDSEVVWRSEEDPDVLDLSRPNGWRSITNFGPTPKTLPPGQILIASGAITDQGVMPPETTVWLRTEI